MYLRHYDLNSQYKMSTICRIRFHIEDLQSGEHLALKFELNVFYHLLTLSGCHDRQHGSRVELRKTCLSWKRLSWRRKLKGVQLLKYCYRNQLSKALQEEWSQGLPSFIWSQMQNLVRLVEIMFWDVHYSCHMSSFFPHRDKDIMLHWWFRVGTWTEERWCLPLLLLDFC